MKTNAESDTKQRLIRAGERLFRTQGYAGTGLKQLTQAAEAPWGSMYHFFPNGKEQLGAEVVAYAGELYRAMCQAAFERYNDPAEAVERIFLGEAKILETSAYRDGCPVASVTLDIASTNEGLRAACAKAFTGWLNTIAQAFGTAGAPDADALALAGFVLSSLEGAIVLSRAGKDAAPLRHSARFVRQVVAHEVGHWAGLKTVEAVR